MERFPKFTELHLGMVGDRGKDGELIWSRVIFYGNDDNVFYAKFAYDLPRRVRINWNDLHGQFQGEPVPLDCVYPSFSDELFTVMPDMPEPLPPNIHLKRPCFGRYKHERNDEYNTIAELLRHEALACEAFKRSPHPNIAKYYGCRVRHGRITGLCFEKYEVVLEELITDCPSRIDKKKCLESVRCGIEHMHSVGYVHNDINPRNVMIDSEGNAVIIDFDSCRQIGEKVGRKFGSEGFCVFGTEFCLEKNDYYALGQLEKYLDEKL